MCLVTNCAQVREDYARARIQSTMMLPGLEQIERLPHEEYPTGAGHQEGVVCRQL